MPGNPIWDVDNGGKWHINLPDYMGKPGQVLAVNTEGTETIWGEGVSVITPTEDDIGKCIMVDPDLNLIFDKELPDILPGMKNWRLAVKDDESGCEWVEDEKIPVYHHVLKVQNKGADGKVLSFGYISIYTKYRFLYKDDVSKLVEWVAEEQPDGLTVPMTVVDVDPASYESSKLHVEKVTYTAAGGTLVTNDPPRLGTIDFSTMEELLDPSMYLHKVTLASMAAAPADPLFHMTFNILDYQSDPVDSLTDLKERLRYMGFVTRTSTLSAVGGVSMDYDEETENWNEQYIASGIYEPTMGTMANSLFVAFTKPMDTESKGAIDWFNFENRNINFNDIMTELQGIGSISGGAYLSSEIPDYSIINAKNKLIVNLDGTHLEWLDEPIIPKCGPDDWRKVLTVNEAGDLYWDYADGIAHDIEFPEEFENRKPFILEVDLDDEHPKGLYIYHTPGIIPPGVVRGEYTFNPDINEKIRDVLPWPSIPLDSTPWQANLDYNVNFTSRGEEFVGIRFVGNYNDSNFHSDDWSNGQAFMIQYKRPNGNYIEVYRSFQLYRDPSDPKEYGNWIYDQFRTPGASRAYATVNFGLDQEVPGELSNLMNNSTSVNEGWWELLADVSRRSSGGLNHDVVFPIDYEPNELFVLDETLSDEYPKGLYRYKASSDPGTNPDGRFTLKDDLDTILRTVASSESSFDLNFTITADFDGTGTRTHIYKGVDFIKTNHESIEPGEIIFKENIDAALRLMPDGEYPINCRSCWEPNMGVYTGVTLSAFKVDKSEPNNMKLYGLNPLGEWTTMYTQGAPYNGWVKTTTWCDRIMLDSPITDPLFASFIDTIGKTVPVGPDTDIAMYIRGFSSSDDLLVYYTGTPDDQHPFHGLGPIGKYWDIEEQVLSEDSMNLLKLIGYYEHPFDEGYVKGRATFEVREDLGPAIFNLCPSSWQKGYYPVKVLVPGLKGTTENKTFDGFVFQLQGTPGYGSAWDAKMGLYKGSGSTQQVLWFAQYERYSETSSAHHLVWYVDECKNLDFGGRQYVGYDLSKLIYDYTVTPDTTVYTWDLIADHTKGAGIIDVLALPADATQEDIYRLLSDTPDYRSGIYAKKNETEWSKLDDSGIRHGVEFPTDIKDQELFVLDEDLSEEYPKGLYLYEQIDVYHGIFKLIADHTTSSDIVYIDKEDFDALTDEEKNNGKLYHIRGVETEDDPWIIQVKDLPTLEEGLENRLYHVVDTANALDGLFYKGLDHVPDFDGIFVPDNSDINTIVGDFVGQRLAYGTSFPDIPNGPFDAAYEWDGIKWIFVDPDKITYTPKYNVMWRVTDVNEGGELNLMKIYKADSTGWYEMAGDEPLIDHITWKRLDGGTSGGGGTSTVSVDDITIDRNEAGELEVKLHGLQLDRFAQQSLTDVGKVVKVDEDGYLKLLPSGGIIDVEELPAYGDELDPACIYRLTVDTDDYPAGLYAINAAKDQWVSIDFVIDHGEEFPDTSDPDLIEDKSLFILEKDIEDEEKVKGLYIYRKAEDKFELLADANHESIRHGNVFPDDLEIGELFVLEEDHWFGEPKGLYIHRGDGSFTPGVVKAGTYVFKDDISKLLLTIPEDEYPMDFTIYGWDDVVCTSMIIGRNEEDDTIVLKYKVTDPDHTEYEEFPVYGRMDYYGPYMWEDPSLQTIVITNDTTFPNDIAEFFHRAQANVTFGNELLADVTDPKKFDANDILMGDPDTGMTVRGAYDELTGEIDYLYENKVDKSPYKNIVYGRGEWPDGSPAGNYTVDVQSIPQQPNASPVNIPTSYAVRKAIDQMGGVQDTYYLPSVDDPNFNRHVVYRLLRKIDGYDPGLWCYSSDTVDYIMPEGSTLPDPSTMAEDTVIIFADGTVIPLFPRDAKVLHNGAWMDVPTWQPAPNTYFLRTATGAYMLWGGTSWQPVLTPPKSWVRLDNLEGADVEYKTYTEWQAMSQTDRDNGKLYVVSGVLTYPEPPAIESFNPTDVIISGSVVDTNGIASGCVPYVIGGRLLVWNLHCDYCKSARSGRKLVWTWNTSWKYKLDDTAVSYYRSQGMMFYDRGGEDESVAVTIEITSGTVYATVPATVSMTSMPLNMNLCIPVRLRNTPSPTIDTTKGFLYHKGTMFGEEVIGGEILT